MARPDDQMGFIIFGVYKLYERIVQKRDPNAKLRIAYFRVEGQHLVPVQAWDGMSEDCVRGVFKECKDRFHVTRGVGRCLAVAAIYDKRILIVEDAEEAASASDVPFEYFVSAQRDRIRSMVAIPLGDSVSGGYAHHVVCIDTDQVGFFRRISSGATRIGQKEHGMPFAL